MKKEPYDGYRLYNGSREAGLNNGKNRRSFSESDAVSMYKSYPK